MIDRLIDLVQRTSEEYKTKHVTLKGLYFQETLLLIRYLCLFEPWKQGIDIVFFLFITKKMFFFHFCYHTQEDFHFLFLSIRTVILTSKNENIFF